MTRSVSAVVATAVWKNQETEDSRGSNVDTRCHCPGIWETSQVPTLFQPCFGPDHNGLTLDHFPSRPGIDPEGKSWLVPLSFPVLPESEPQPSLQRFSPCGLQQQLLWSQLGHMIRPSGTLPLGFQTSLQPNPRAFAGRGTWLFWCPAWVALPYLLAGYGVYFRI